MSKILRRPMFRGGGTVSSYGNGIATGLADGGRVNLQIGGKPTDRFTGFKSGQVPNQNEFLNFLNAQGGSQLGPVVTGGAISDAAMKRFQTPEFYEDYIKLDEGEDETLLNSPIMDYSKIGMPGKKSNYLSLGGSKGMGETKGLADLMKSQLLDDIPSVKDNIPKGGADIEGVVEEQSTVDPGITPDDGYLPIEPENPEEPEINVRDLIQTNADMFNEMLSAGTKERNEKRLKKARIQDISDVGLDIFARSTKPGADVKTMLGGAAERMVNKPSRTEKLIDKQMDQEDKTKMQATALAINDFIAGKRSDEAIEKLIAQSGLSLANQQKLYNYKASLESGIKKSKSVTTLMGEDKSNDRTIQKIRKNSKVFAENNGLDMPTSIITKETKGSELPIVLDTKTLLVEENKNQVFIDETTKEVFQVIEDPNGDGYIKKRLY